MKKNCFLLLLFVIQLTAAAQNDNTTLWRILPPGGVKSSYLFGTIHLPRQSLLSFSDSVYAALNEVESFYGELNYEKMMDEMGNPEHTEYFNGRLAYLDSVSKTPAWEQMVNRINRRYNTQLKPDSLQQFIEFGTKFSADLYKPDTKDAGIMDLLLSKHAKSLGKEVGGLETIVLQIGMMYELIDTRLKDSTILYDDEDLLMRKMLNWYALQRLDSIGILVDKLHPRYKALIFQRRNRTMADSIEKHTRAQTGFFAVGCGHLPGDSGVINHLRRIGFTVSPVHGKEKLSLLVINEMYGLWKKTNDAEKETGRAVERIEEIKEDVMISASEAPPPPPARKVLKKTSRNKKKK